MLSLTRIKSPTSNTIGIGVLAVVASVFWIGVSPAAAQTVVTQDVPTHDVLSGDQAGATQEVPSQEVPTKDQEVAPQEVAPQESATQNVDGSKPAEPSADATPVPPFDVPAQSSPSNGRSLHQRLTFTVGYAAPSGDFVEGSAMKDAVVSAIPLGLDYQVFGRRGLGLGLYLQIAPGRAGSVIEECEDCSTYGGRLGLQLVQHFMPKAFTDPWIAVGGGYEFFSISQDVTLTGVTDSGAFTSVDGSHTTTASSTPELMAQVGVDFGDRLRIGPYLFASWGRFSKLESKVTCDDAQCPAQTVTSNSDDIDSSRRSSHYWFGGGLRVSLGQ